MISYELGKKNVTYNIPVCKMCCLWYGFLGLVAINLHGEVVKIQIHKCRVDIFEAAEALAILKAINFAAKEGLINIICESDA